MATIQSSIKLTDGMTPALRSMNKALGIVINSFESMQRASGRSVDTKSIATARQELSKAQVQFNKIEKEIRENTTAQNNFNKSVRDGTGAANGLWGKLKGIAAAYVGFQSVKGIVGMADTLTMTNARLNMINDGSQTTAELQDKIYQAAMRSRGAYTDTADAVAKLGQRAGDIFKSNDETIAFAETLNKMFVVAGASQQEMASATLQLTQALGSGVLRGEEFNAVFESAPNIMRAVADYMNIPIGQLRNMAAEGKVSAQIVKNAMFAAADDVNKQFESIPYTWGQVWTTIKNYTIKAAQPILDTISRITSSERFIQFANTVTNALGIVINILGTCFDWALKVFSVFYDNWSFIGPVVWGIVAAFAAYKLALMAIWTWQKLCLIAEGAMTVVRGFAALATWACTGATWAQAAAQWGLNTALLACPLTWIVLAIIALIVIIYLVIAAINKFAGTSYSATGFVAGCFRALGAIVYNIIAYMWNHIATFVEFFANVFKHPIYSIKKLFVNLATNFLDLIISMTKGWDKFATNMVNAIIKAVNAIIDAWNWLADSWLGEKLGLGKAGHIAERKSITSDLQNAKASLEASVANQPDDYWTAPRMEMKTVSESFDKGYEWGKNAADGFSDKLNTDMLSPNGAMMSDPNVNPYVCDTGLGSGDKLNDVGKALSGGYGKNPALGDIAKNTNDIAKNTTEIAGNEEDLSYMRDLAEQEAINRYTMTDLKIEMTNNNKINSNMDLDAVVKYLQDKVYEGVLATADGVHF